ncbi:LON peptidase substrate-binding domain-containing protein [Aquisalimonas lutea]|uniref:LON peptidase substrate-binding domain-containing protein n=1 Tax=Aquisalimonas lutea TaxID=1327750 RepID=UPI0025B2AAC1|nr:LON peptidase substrate-binding domain-containing protein [Aquisalimonas lutea]MDN3516066.1 LON peptidase substrate-binding domain-containing protein [Aquisalimonas lutea]
MTTEGPESAREIAIFPLRTVLFPGGPLPLRIFEPRYVDMVSRCLRQEQPFGVCLIREGREVADAATPHGLGTLARIVDWEQRSDGLLGVTALGEERFRILRSRLAPDRLRLAEIERLGPEPAVTLPPQPADITQLLDRVLAMTSLGYHHCPRRDTDAAWLAGRLAEVLPVSLEHKQQLLSLDDPVDRLRTLQEIVPQLRLE